MTNNVMKALWLSVLLLATNVTASVAVNKVSPAPAKSVIQAATITPAMKFKEGVHYKRVKVTGNVDAITEPKVVEFFWYGCPSCYRLEEPLMQWLSKKPSHVEFQKVPNSLGRPEGAIHSKLFHVAEKLHANGYLDNYGPMFHLDVFTAYHVEQNRLNTKQDLAKFFKSKGVDEDVFNSMFDSPAVDSAFRRTEAMSKRYPITGVPAVIINDQFKVNIRALTDYDEYVEVINYLLTKGLSEKKSS